MKRIFAFCLLFVCSISVYSQRKATVEQQRYMCQKITEASASLKTLQCRFVQTKEVSVLNGKMISRGMMYYREGNQLRWEYTSPYNYIFLISGGKVMMKSDRSKNIIDIRSSKLFQEITRIMMSGVNGTGLKDTSRYQVFYYDGSPLWQIVLIPKAKVMKQMFHSIQLFVSPTDYQVDRVVMTEANGDKTVISLRDKMINKSIGDEKFAIR